MPNEEIAAAVATILEEWDGSSIRMATALPAPLMLSRSLTFPFSDQRKIASSITPRKNSPSVNRSLSKYQPTRTALGMV